MYWIQVTNYSPISAEATADIEKPNIAGGKYEYGFKTADV
jgi:hypothetical protein